MATAQIWLEVLATAKAVFDAATSTANFYDAYQKHKAEKDTQLEASRVSAAYSTYSDEEVLAILNRLNGCRDRFVTQGGGEERAKCFCSVFNEVKKGNGGALPPIDDWKRMYSKMCLRGSRDSRR